MSRATRGSGTTLMIKCRTRKMRPHCCLGEWTVTADTGEVLSVFFTVVFSCKIPQGSKGRSVSSEWESSQGLLVRSIDPYKPMGPRGLHPRLLGEPADVLARLRCIIFRRSWRSLWGPQQLEKGRYFIHLQKGTRVRPENFRLVRLTLLPQKIHCELSWSTFLGTWSRRKWLGNTPGLH